MRTKFWTLNQSSYFTPFAFAGLALVLLTACQASGQAVLNWETNLELAKQQAAASNRLVLVHFWAPWCTWCAKMEQEVLSNPMVEDAIQTDYVPVRLNADHNNLVARQYGIKKLPTDVIIAPDGRLIDRQPGFMARDQYIARLRQAVSDARRAPGMGGTLAASEPPSMPTSSQLASRDAIAPSTGYSLPAMSVPSPVMQQQPYLPGSTGGNLPNQATTSLDARPPIQAPNNPAFANQGPSDLGNPMSQPITQPAQPISPYAINGMNPQPGPQPVAGNQFGQPPANQQPIQPSREAPNVANEPLPSPASQDPSASPFALDGFCPVELVENKVWKFGDKRWGANHRGCTYLFSGLDQQQRFLQDPDRYSPVASGVDIVLAITKGQIVPGRRQHGVFFREQIYLFDNEETLQMFSAEPAMYVQRLDAFNKAAAAQQGIRR